MAGVEFIEGGEIVGRRVDSLCGERDETIGDTAERREKMTFIIMVAFAYRGEAIRVSL